MLKELEFAEAEAKEKSRIIIEVLEEEHAPMMIMLTPNGFSVVLLTGVDKESFALVTTMLLKSLQALGYVFICEAWEASCSPDSLTAQRVLAEGIPVRELPLDDRREVLTIFTVEKGKESRMSTAQIDNLKSGRKLGEFKTMPESEPVGRMVVLDW